MMVFESFIRIDIKWSALSFLFLVFNVSLLAKGPILTQKDLGSPPPKVIRTCCSFGADVGVMGIPLIKLTDITSLDQIGNHHYLGSKEEGNGIIYTAKGGFIDLGHLRDYADWTAYLYSVIQVEKDELGEYLIELGHEGGQKSLTLFVDSDLDSLTAYDLAGKIAFDLSLWHEISTWFGASYVPLIPERFSSFSPEDMYSNLLGAKLGIEALKSDLEYDEAMTLLIERTLYNLGAVESMEDTYLAMEDVQDIWWTNDKKLPSSKVIIKRNFDAGDEIFPWLTSSNIVSSTPHILEWPDESLSDYFELRVKVNKKFVEQAEMDDRPDRHITEKDFRSIIHIISTDSFLSTRKKDESKQRSLKNPPRKETSG